MRVFIWRNYARNKVTKFTTFCQALFGVSLHLCSAKQPALASGARIVFKEMSLVALFALAIGMNAQESPAPLRVMSFNIRYGTADDGENRWEVRKPRTIQALQKRRPELIGLQETLDFQIEDLKKGLEGHQSVGVGRDDGKSDGEFSAIVYDPKRLQVLRSDTFWLSDTPNVVASRSWGNHVVRICTWAYFKDLRTGKYFYHFNAHLDHESQPSREKSVALILKHISERGTDDPVIFTGDFNAGEENPAVKAVLAAGYRDSFRVLHPDVKEVGTFSGFKPTFGKDKIDYIFVDPSIRVETSEIVRDQVDGHWISDHSPVTAEIVIP